MGNLDYKLDSLSSAPNMGNLDYKLDSLSSTTLDYYLGNLDYKWAQSSAHPGTGA